MALDNMAVEPRREITETLVGLALALPVIYLDYLFAAWFVPACKDPNFHGFWAMALGMVIGAVGLFIGGVLAMILSYIALVAIHALGEVGCAIIEAFGIQIRPKQRYRLNAIGEVVPRN